MTTTREYYEALIDAFNEITQLGSNEISKYLKVKEDLYHLINRVKKFNLFELTFSADFMNTLSADLLDNLLEEKLLLINELHYELFACLDTTRLRYGGELMQYMLKLKKILLQLQAHELAILNANLKIPKEYYYPHDMGMIDEAKRAEQVKKIASETNNWPVKLDKTKIKKSYYKDIETSLRRAIASYQDYIFENYPEIANEFSFFQRKVRGYITQAMPSNIYEFRLHAYEPMDGDRNVRVEQTYYDFYPSYFFNLEEISDVQVSAMVIGLQKNTSSLESLFNVPFIHRELLEIFIRLSSEGDIIRFIAFLLKCDKYHIEQEVKSDVYRFDLQGTMGNQLIFFEIFHHHLRSLGAVIEKIQLIKAAKPDGKLIFIFTSRPEEDVLQLLSKHKIETIYLYNLFERHFQQGNSQIIHWYIRSVLPNLKPSKAQPGIGFQGKQLIKRLRECNPGDRDWASFEQIGIQIFKFLFADNFRTYLAEIQSENGLKNHRRDLIVNNNYRQHNSFWAEIKDKFDGSAIIVDFKNYSDLLTADTFFNVAKYTTKGVGNFAIVFSRKGIDETAMKEQQTLFRAGKLLIEFSDNELVDMIQEKIIGKDPIDRLDSKKFQLVKRA